MDFYIFCGYAACVLFTIMLIPQIYKVHKYKSAEDLSFFFLFIFLLGSLLMLIYAIKIKSLPIIINNALAMLSGFILLGYYIHLETNLLKF